jgi:Spy/CpxP family protein refolding chaperone
VPIPPPTLYSLCAPSQETHGAFDPHALTPAQTAFLHALSNTMRGKMVALKREGDAELRRLVEADGRGGDPLQ